MMRGPWSFDPASPPGRITLVEGSVERLDALIRSGARRWTGYQRRSYLAEVATELCGGSSRQAERRFGWGRETVEKGRHELRHGGPLPGELRRAGPSAERTEGPAIGGRDPRPRRAPHIHRSGTQVAASVYQPVGGRGARGPDRQGLSPRGGARRAHDAGHPQSDELPPQTDPEGQAAEEDQGDRRDLRQRGAGARPVPG